MKCIMGFTFPCNECYYKICEDFLIETDEEDDIERCDYTGEICFGNKLFCEECDVIYEEGEG